MPFDLRRSMGWLNAPVYGFSIYGLSLFFASAFGLRWIPLARVALGRKFSLSGKGESQSPSSEGIRTQIAASSEVDSAERAQLIRDYWQAPDKDDEHAFLKDVLGEPALDFVRERNEHCLRALEDPSQPASGSHALYQRILQILDSKEKIPYMRKIDGFFYNFWQDEKNKRGLWRRTPLSSFTEGGLCSAETEWEEVLDVDALCAQEGESWVWKGHVLLEETPTVAETQTQIGKLSPGKSRRSLLKLSRGGADAVVIREFDLESKQFVSPAEGGFVLPEAKSRVSWRSRDVLIVGTDLQPAKQDGKDDISIDLTDSGYPRRVREWRRGTSLADAPVVYEGEKSDVSVMGYKSLHQCFSYEFRCRSTSFYTSLYSINASHGGKAGDGDAKGGAGWVELSFLPDDMEVSHFQDQLLLSLRSDWVLPCTDSKHDRVFKQGALLAVSVADLLTNKLSASFTELFTPTTTCSLESFCELRDFVLIVALDTVKTRLSAWRYKTPAPSPSSAGAEAAVGAGAAAAVWEYVGAEDRGQIRGCSVTAVDPQALAPAAPAAPAAAEEAAEQDFGNAFWLSTSSFLCPASLSLVQILSGPDSEETTRTTAAAERNSVLPKILLAKGKSPAKGVQREDEGDGVLLPMKLVMRKALPAQFDASGLEEQQCEATSRDGTKVPYFIISRKGAKRDGQSPTLLYGYGGFEISLTPGYSSVVGACWLNRCPQYLTSSPHQDHHQQQQQQQQEDLESRVYVVANIRGGGEFGPAWHQAAKRENRCKAYEDFIAVAEDLIERGVTSSSKLGVRGGSNGGLLMGNIFNLRPDLFGAVCCAVPLLDMKCYHTLLAGASWVAEYGDPTNPQDWEFLQRYSAYQNIDPLLPAARRPAFLMTTSTRDDRVHPYHARAFVKRLQDVYSRLLQAGQAGEGEELVQQGGSGRQSALDLCYFENIEGGHGGAADNKQQAFMNALYIDFLFKTIAAR